MLVVYFLIFVISIDGIITKDPSSNRVILNGLCQLESSKNLSRVSHFVFEMN
jgi:hypothetical protein